LEWIRLVFSLFAEILWAGAGRLSGYLEKQQVARIFKDGIGL
jgi:hypothetical protein